MRSSGSREIQFSLRDRTWGLSRMESVRLLTSGALVNLMAPAGRR